MKHSRNLMECPYCHKAGKVTTKIVKDEGKRTLARTLITTNTLGLSKLVGVGGHKKIDRRIYACGNCKASWNA